MIKAENLSIGYDKLVIQSELNFCLEKGEIGVVIGPNGTGKTTLLKTLIGWNKILGGNLFLHGKKLGEYSPMERAGTIGMIWAKNDIPYSLKVGDLISIGRKQYTNWWGKLSKEDHSIISEVLERLHINDLVNSPCGTLSDGQIQKVLIAKVLVQQCPIILLDEPTSHLDIGNQMELMETLKEIAKELHRTILFSTHQIELAFEYASFFMVFQNGANHFNAKEKILESELFTKLFEKHQLRFDRRLLKFVKQT